MSTGFSEDQRRLLRAAFADSASNALQLTATALTGGYRPDEGLRNLLPRELTDYGRKQALRESLLAFLDAGKSPSVEVAAGDRAMELDPALFFHFRLRVEGVRLFVKVLLDEQGRDSLVRVISVKRDDRAWSEQ